jgi:hypothetical protein
MGEEILAAAIGRDEAEALRIVEPLHGACSHVIPFLEKVVALRAAIRAALRAR